MINPASPKARPDEVSNQFQQSWGVHQAVLFGVEHEKSLAHGNTVHPRARREAIRILPATVQHHHQRQSLA
jgi:hypothetical protein